LHSLHQTAPASNLLSWHLLLCLLQIAAALQAEKLILMTDVPGVLKDKDDVSTKFASLNIRECRQLTEDGIIAGGMIPKVQCCIRCLSQVSALHQSTAWKLWMAAAVLVVCGTLAALQEA
jgi:carbamate kinase